MTELAHESTLPDALKKAENLPSLPAVAVEVLRLTRSDDTTIEDLAEVIGRDPVLSAKLLKLANSAMFNPGHNEVKSLEAAAITLGLKTVKLMSLSFSLVSSLPQKSNGEAYDYDRFWQRSLTAAVAGRSFGRHVRSPQADEAFTCGLFSRLGQLVLFHCLEEQYAPVLVKAGGALPTCALEQEHLGFDNTLVGYSLLKSWELPRELYEVVGHSNDPESLPEDSDETTRSAAKLGHVAELCCRVLCDDEKGHAMRALVQVCQDEYGMEGEEVDEFLQSLQAGIRETADMMSLELQDDTDFSKLVNDARAQIVQISLDATMKLQQAERRAHVLKERKEELKGKAYVDKLTKLGNRAFFDEHLAIEVERRKEDGCDLALGLLMVDVDHFKKFNDTNGHQVGDEVLEIVGRCLKEYTRDSDIPARYGGEEFAVIAPETSLDGLRVLAERLRFRIAQQRHEVDGEELGVTVSIGGACIAAVTDDRDGQVLIKVVNHYLYQAKKRGRNRCEFYHKRQLPKQEG